MDDFEILFSSPGLWILKLEDKKHTWKMPLFSDARGGPSLDFCWLDHFSTHLVEQDLVLICSIQLWLQSWPNYTIQ